MSQRTAGNPPKQYHRSAAPKAAPAAAGAPTTTEQQAGITLGSILSVSRVLKFLLWCGGWYASIRVEFGSVFLVVSILVAIFLNLGNNDENETKTGQPKLSAYSVFNEGAKRIAGTMDAESFENEIRHKPRTAARLDLDLADGEQKAHYARPSKAANKPCVCGSGKKYKLCCSRLTANEQQEEAEWAAYDKEWGRSSR